MISEERKVSLAHVIADTIWDDDLVEYADEDQAIRWAKKAVEDFFKYEAEMDARARQKIQTLKRGVPEGSPEWDIMYKKYLEEERKKHA